MMNETTNALVVKQWLSDWDAAIYEPAPPRTKPQPYFYLFRLNAKSLKRLSGVYRRDDSKHPSEDINIQRQHSPSRSREILRYLHDGYPLSRIGRENLVDPREAVELRMPGWVPTAIVANILVAGDRRGPYETQILAEDLITVRQDQNSDIAQLILPEGVKDDSWDPKVHPLEIIDGQHRLWALEESAQPRLPLEQYDMDRAGSIELPVVAFRGLDRTWQAYLFYTINQLPKRIDQSLVFDLYPLLRNESWLQRYEGKRLYQETRAQDLTIILWSHSQSPWKDRIIRLGGRERGKVTQASFIRSLTASFIKTYRTEGKRVGGLFGSPRGSSEMLLSWGREQQAAFLIVCWQEIESAVRKTQSTWAKTLRNLTRFSSVRSDQTSSQLDPAFAGTESMLGTDQGVRGVFGVLNDLLVVAFSADQLDLRMWLWVPKLDHEDDEAVIADAISSCRDSLPKTIAFVRDVSAGLATFDWRLPAAIDEGKEREPYLQASAYRGSGGYALLRRNLLQHLQVKKSPRISKHAHDIIDAEEVEED
jgi:hypothetical protein